MRVWDPGAVRLLALPPPVHQPFSKARSAHSDLYFASYFSPFDLLLRSLAYHRFFPPPQVLVLSTTLIALRAPLQFFASSVRAPPLRPPPPTLFSRLFVLPFAYRRSS